MTRCPLSSIFPTTSSSSSSLALNLNLPATEGSESRTFPLLWISSCSSDNGQKCRGRITQEDHNNPMEMLSRSIVNRITALGFILIEFLWPTLIPLICIKFTIISFWWLSPTGHNRNFINDLRHSGCHLNYFHPDVYSSYAKWNASPADIVLRVGYYHICEIVALSDTAEAHDLTLKNMWANTQHITYPTGYLFYQDRLPPTSSLSRRLLH